MKRILKLPKVAVIAAGALAAVLSTNVLAANTSPLYYSAATGNTYQAYYVEKGWPAASQSCRIKGGHLVVINNQSEYADTVEPMLRLNATHDYWLGVTLTTAGPTTVTGQPYFKLSYPYPLFAGAYSDGLTRYQDYAQASQFWDWSLNVTTKYYVCEFEHAPY